MAEKRWHLRAATGQQGPAGTQSTKTVQQTHPVGVGLHPQIRDHTTIDRSRSTQRLMHRTGHHSRRCPASPPVCEHAECHRGEGASTLRPCGRRNTPLRGICYRRRCQTRMAAPRALHSSNVHTHGRHRSSATHAGRVRGTMRAACCGAVCCAVMPPPGLGDTECPGRGCGNSVCAAPAAGEGYAGASGACGVAAARRAAACAGVDAEGIGAAEAGTGAVDVDKDGGKRAFLRSGGPGSCSTQCQRSWPSQAGP